VFCACRVSEGKWRETRSFRKRARELELKIKNQGWRRVLICKPKAEETDPDLEQTDVFMTNDKEISQGNLLRAWSFRDRIDKDKFYECAKDNLGFDQYQVRSDRAIRRHWYLAFLMYTYLMYHRQEGSFYHWSKKTTNSGRDARVLEGKTNDPFSGLVSKE